jgi:hypothetical protein
MKEAWLKASKQNLNKKKASKLEIRKMYKANLSGGFHFAVSKTATSSLQT